MIYTIGESVMDIIVNDFDNVRIRPGGSMLNTAISLGRLGLPVSHISYLASDMSSEKLIVFLNDNHVETEFVLRLADKTNLALAYLDSNNDANYVFYKSESNDDITLSFPNVRNGDIILFGSFFSLNKAYRKCLTDFLNDARDKSALIIYDPNFREAHLNKLEEYKLFIEENFKLAHIVKASNEDFYNIYNLKNGVSSFNHLEQFKTDILFYTKGALGSECFSNNIVVSEKTEKLNLVSTIGAGDTFSAGIIYSLYKDKVTSHTLKDIKIYQLKEYMRVANSMSANVCESFDNYIDLLFKL